MLRLGNLFILLVTLTLFSCVQEKQATTCSPNSSDVNCTTTSVSGDPYITIKSYSPTSNIQVVKNDSSMINLSIEIDPKFNGQYRVEWERNYYGYKYYFAGSSNIARFIPSDYATELGPHYITAKVVANDIVVDSKTFQITLSDTPRPVVQSSSLMPQDFSINLNPLSPPQEFSFNIKNNNSFIDGAGYKVSWSLYKNNVLLPVYNENDLFTNIDPTSSSTFYYGGSDPSEYKFVPSDLGVGSYKVKAIVSNALPGEVVAEFQWYVNIKHSPLANITSRSTYASGPYTPTQSVLSYDGVPFSDTTALPTGLTPNFGIEGETNQANFCVTLDRGEGTYDGDGRYVRVEYYLYGITLIHTAWTSEAESTVCLSEAPSFSLDLLVFHNSTPGLSQFHFITARVFDEATGFEYSDLLMNEDILNAPPMVTKYPLRWNIETRPTNYAPTIAFRTPGSGPAASCTPKVGYESTQYDCDVNQDEFFTIGFEVEDDFYNEFSTYDDKFEYSFELRKDGIALGTVDSTCSKSTSDSGSDQDATGINDFTGPYFICGLKIPHFDDSNTRIEPADTLTVVASLQDAGSPYSPTPLPSNTLQWNLDLTETNPNAPTIAAWNALVPYDEDSTHSTTIYDAENDSNPFIIAFSEDTNLKFRIEVQDDEGDDIKVTVKEYTCFETYPTPTPTSCTTTNTIHSQTYPNSYGSDYFRIEFTQNSGSEWRIEDNSGCENTPSSCIKQRFYRVEVEDVPDTISLKEAGTPVEPTLVFVNVNPAPELDNSTEDPSQDDTLYVMSGFPITLYAGTISDASAVDDEKDIQRQWYVKKQSEELWTEIPGATGDTLKWSPASDDTVWGENINIRMCFGDGTLVYPVDSDQDERCSQAWTIRPWDPWYSPSSLYLNSSHVAFHQDTKKSDTFYAGILNDFNNDGANSITISKFFLDKAHTGFTPFDRPYSSISIKPSPNNFDSFAYDLTLNGTNDNLMMAYRYELTSDPGNFKIVVANIDTHYDNSIGKSHADYPNPSKFGFKWWIDGIEGLPGAKVEFFDTITLDVSNIAHEELCDSECTYYDHPYIQISESATQPQQENGDVITINGENITFSSVPGSVLTEADISSKRICYDCTAEVQVKQIAEIINSSDEAAWQGITAEVTSYIFGGITTIWKVTFYGAATFQNAFVYDDNQASALGQLHIYSNYWYLPFVNASLSGADQYKISFLSGAVPDENTKMDDEIDESDLVDPYENFDNDFTTNTYKTREIRSAGSGSNIYVAGINLVGSEVTLYKFTRDSTILRQVNYTSKITLFSTLGAAGFEKVRIAANASRVHVAARDTRGDWYYAQYDSSSFEKEVEAKIEDIASPAVANLFNPGLNPIEDLELSSDVSNFNINIVLSKTTLFPVKTQPYLITYNGSIFICANVDDSCAPSSALNLEESSATKPVMMAVSPTWDYFYGIGSEGKTANENNGYVTLGVAMGTDNKLNLLFLQNEFDPLSATEQDSTFFLYRPSYNP